MSTLKASKPGLQDEAAGAMEPPRAGSEPATKSAEIRSLEIDPESYDGGDPYNRTGLFLVEQLRKLENGR